MDISDKYRLPTKQELLSVRSQLKGVNGRRILRSLFIETIGSEVEENGFVSPIFTLKDVNIEKDGVFYWSLKNIYFSYDHIPGFEYEFAMDVFGDWEHWVMLADSFLIKPHVDAWRDEMTIKIQAKAIEAMMKSALRDGSKGTPAAKFLADRGWEVKRGRPSKAEIEREKKIQSGVSKEVAEDMERLGLSVVNGGKEQ